MGWNGVRATAALLTLPALAGVALAQLTVVNTSPPRGTMTGVGTAVSVTFNEPVLRSSVTNRSFWVFGRWSGVATGAVEFSAGDTVVTLKPARNFAAGEPVLVTLADTLQGAGGSSFRPAGYQYRFMTRARGASMNYTLIDTVSDRDASNAQTRIYGALGSDVNGDGWLDVTCVNEVSSDLRVFLSRADGSGLYHPFLTPPEPLNFETSPNEPGDFNFDGIVDIALASSATARLSILLGDGDGTFQPQQLIAVGAQPHGLAVLDVDGDGDLDVATANTNGNNVSISLNNGSGVFGPAASFDAGCNGEYGLGAADMNQDGILDLVVGCRFSQDVRILRGNGDGTFTGITTRAAGGLVWMVGVGDVNGDGNDDVATSNSGSNTGSIMLGNGAGGLGPATTYPTASGAIATDFGDFDGDGDLDWVLSSHQGGQWRIYKNNGNGTFAFDRDFDAPANPACAMIYDFDNDRDLDLCLLDEIADVFELWKNDGTRPIGDLNCDGVTNFDDIDGFISALISPAQYAADYPGCDIIAGDVNDDGLVNFDDIDGFIGCLIGGCR